MVLWLYFVNFSGGLLVLLPAYATLQKQTGSSLEYLKLLNNFDYTVYSDFMQNSQSAIDPLLSVGSWLGVLYLVGSIFFSGGILLSVSPSAELRQPFRLSRFLPACIQFFGRFFRLFLSISGLILVVAVFWMLVGFVVGTSLSDTANEKDMIWVFLICLFFFSLVTLFLLCVGDCAKILLFRHDETRVFLVFRQAMRLVWTHFLLIFGFYLLLMSMGAACFAIYFLIDSWIVTRGWLSIAALFLFQQLFIFSRVFLKVWTLATALQLVTSREGQPALYRPV
ncbi:hypothetical protein GCM10028803_13960 [Larkinella knui]